MSVLMNIGCCFTAPGGNRTPDNPAPETGALSTELQTHNTLQYNNIFINSNQYFFRVNKNFMRF